MDWPVIKEELSFRTSRSSGAGGQHVNKTETKVEVLFDVVASNGLDDEEKQLVIQRLGNRMNNDGLIALSVQNFPSQTENKRLALSRLKDMLAKSLVPVKKRGPTQPTKASVENRLAAKKRVSQKKDTRKKPDR